MTDAGRRWYDPFTGTPGTEEESADGGDRPGAVGGATAPAPEPIGAVAAQLVGRRQWGQRLEGARIHSVWPRIAGPAVAAHVTPVRLMGGVLVLRADSGAWATQVRYLAGELAERANAEFGATAVTRVQVTT